MKAVVIEANEKVAYKEIPTPEAGPGEVRVKVAVCGICGSDIPRVFDYGAHNYPVILGHEFAGTVDQVGPGVEDIALGTHVTAAPLIPCHDCEDCRRGDYSLCGHYSFIGSRQQGAMAEYVVVPRANIVPISEAIPFEQAATIEPSTVALHGIRLANYQPGKRVAVLGCGIIGLYTVQWVKLLGAESVTAVGRGASGLEAARLLGADEILSTKGISEEEFAGRLDKRGYDYVFECSGSTQTMKLALKAVAKKGTVCFVGTPKNELTFTVPLWENINRKECWVTGSWMSYSAPFPGDEWRMTAEYMESGKLKLVPGMVRGTYPMENAWTAFKDVRENSGGRCLLNNKMN